MTNDCKFGERCKRSHDVIDGHNVEVLRRCGVDVYTKSAWEILDGVRDLLGEEEDRGSCVSEKVAAVGEDETEICIFNLRGKGNRLFL